MSEVSLQVHLAKRYKAVYALPTLDCLHEVEMMVVEDKQ